jgi:hypothetical protein
MAWVKTYPLFFRLDFWHSAASMFLRSNLTGEDPAVLWTRYVQLTQIESVFRSLKSELSMRPVGHQLEDRADAHVLIAFLAYSLQVTLKNRLMMHAPGLTPAAAVEKQAACEQGNQTAGLECVFAAGGRCTRWK